MNITSNVPPGRMLYNESLLRFFIKDRLPESNNKKSKEKLKKQWASYKITYNLQKCAIHAAHIIPALWRLRQEDCLSLNVKASPGNTVRTPNQIIQQITVCISILIFGGFGFELRALSLLGKCSTSWVTPPAMGVTFKANSGRRILWLVQNISLTYSILSMFGCATNTVKIKTASQFMV
jgi:hypothetical protein